MIDENVQTAVAAAQAGNVSDFGDAVQASLLGRLEAALSVEKVRVASTLVTGEPEGVDEENLDEAGFDEGWPSKSPEWSKARKDFEDKLGTSDFNKQVWRSKHGRGVIHSRASDGVRHKVDFEKDQGKIRRVIHPLQLYQGIVSGSAEAYYKRRQKKIEAKHRYRAQVKKLGL